MVSKAVAIESIIVGLANQMGARLDRVDTERIAIMVSEDEWRELEHLWREDRGANVGDIQQIRYLGFLIIKVRGTK